MNEQEQYQATLVRELSQRWAQPVTAEERANALAWKQRAEALQAAGVRVCQGVWCCERGFTAQQAGGKCTEHPGFNQHIAGLVGAGHALRTVMRQGAAPQYVALRDVARLGYTEGDSTSVAPGPVESEATL